MKQISKPDILKTHIQHSTDPVENDSPAKKSRSSSLSIMFTIKENIQLLDYWKSDPCSTAPPECPKDTLAFRTFSTPKIKQMWGLIKMRLSVIFWKRQEAVPGKSGVLTLLFLIICTKHLSEKMLNSLWYLILFTYWKK